MAMVTKYIDLGFTVKVTNYRYYYYYYYRYYFITKLIINTSLF